MALPLFVPRDVSLVNGQLRQCNGARRLPAAITVTKARDVCAAFGLDFEDAAGVPCLPMGSDVCVETSALQAWVQAQLA